MKKVIFGILVTIICTIIVASVLINAIMVSKIAGDVNGDGNVNNKDVVALFRHASGGTIEVDEVACDTNGDGYVNNKDVVALFKHVSDPSYKIYYGNPHETETEETTDNEITEPTLIVDSVKAAAGETVSVLIKIKNNPGIAGAILTVSYDEKLTLISADSEDAFSYLQFTRPGNYSNPCNFLWDSESGMTDTDGTVLNLQFTVSSEATAGDNLEIICSYRSGDIFDENFNDVELAVTDGQITVK